jgi:hypothetical protein
MSKQKAFWIIWIMFTLIVIMFFYAIGELEQMDFGKSIILTIIPLLAAFPIHHWVKSCGDFD